MRITKLRIALGLLLSALIGPMGVDGQAPAPSQPRRLDATWKSSVVEGVIEQLQRAYFDPEAARRIAILLRERVKSGVYDVVLDPAEFARLLSTHLKEVNGDKHLNVRYSAEPLPTRKAPTEPTAEEIKRRRERATLSNFGFREVRVIQGNIGYIRFDEFSPRSWSEETLAATLRFVGHTDALILDLRYNTGGEADMVDAVGEVVAQRLAELTFILTSGGTASAAEAVAFKARERNRATLIGERTLGAGNAGTSRRVDDHFEVFVPVVRGPWDGIGVLPHIEVPADAALTKAQMLAATRLAERTTDKQLATQYAYITQSAELQMKAILQDIRLVPLDTSDAKAVSGRYRYPDFVLRVSAEPELVIAQVEGRARRYEFKRRADGSYYAAADRVVMRFVRNESGRVESLIWLERGRPSPAPRIQ
jgi:hypothetical protein